MTILLALSVGNPEEVVEDARFLVERGEAVTIVTAKRDAWPDESADKIRWVELSTVEQSSPILRVERALVFRVPRLIVALVRSIVRPFLRLAGEKGSFGLERLNEWQTRQGRLSSLFHKRVFGRLYRAIRPYVLWRAARKTDWFAELDGAAISRIVITDATSIPLGWHLARRFTEVPAQFYLDRDSFSNTASE